MNPDVLKIAAITAGALVASPFMLASFRAFFFFGRMSTMAEEAKAAITRTEDAVAKFVTTTETALADHELRLTTIEVERRTEAKFGRRAGDHREPPYDGGEAHAG